MTRALETIEALVPDFQYIEEDRIVTTIGFAASFYFWGGHTAAKRQALIECIEAFGKAYGNELKWGCDPDSWQTRKLSKLPELRDYVASLDEDDCIEWHLSSSDHREEAAEFSISCMTERSWEEYQVSWLTFQLPRSCAFDESQRKKLETLLLLVIERLAPFHGNAGLAAVCPALAIPYEGDVFDVATRYRTLYIEGAGDLLCAQHGPKSINWLTIVGDVLTERLGGPQTFIDYCRRFGIEPIRHGQTLILRAGDVPEIGPVDEPASQAYMAANTALRPLRDGAYDSMGGGSINGEVRFNRCTSDLWIRRFDQQGIWPPTTLVGLGKEPLGKQPSKRIRVKTGELSQHYGRYQRENADKPELILMPGDVAPYWLKLGPHGEYLGRDAVTWELVAEL
jgi:hypothetical protein